MNLLPILGRLRDKCGGDFAAIEVASEIIPLPAEAYPVISLHPLAEMPQANLTIGGIYQLVDVDFGVSIAAAADSEVMGYSALDMARERVRTALLGYQNPKWASAITWSRGELITINAGAILWRDVYSLTIAVTGALTS